MLQDGDSENSERYGRIIIRLDKGLSLYPYISTDTHVYSASTSYVLLVARLALIIVIDPFFFCIPNIAGFPLSEIEHYINVRLRMEPPSADLGFYSRGIMVVTIDLWPFRGEQNSKKLKKDKVKTYNTGHCWSSPTQLLIRLSLAYLGESGRIPRFSSGYGRMWKRMVAAVFM